MWFKRQLVIHPDAEILVTGNSFNKGPINSGDGSFSKNSKITYFILSGFKVNLRQEELFEEHRNLTKF